MKTSDISFFCPKFLSDTHNYNENSKQVTDFFDISKLSFFDYISCLKQTEVIQSSGIITQVIGMVMEAKGPGVPVGAGCRVELRTGGALPVEVVGFRHNQVLLMPLGEMRGIEPGARVWKDSASQSVSVGPEFIGRIVSGLCEPLDGKGYIKGSQEYPIYAEPLNPMDRPRIEEPLDVGIRAINACMTLGKGQRIGIMAGSGVGKSTLMGMIARHTAADVNVIALVGERGRELMDFIERDLGEEGLKRSVVVVATSDQPPLIRIRSAYLATSIAEYFRDQGKDVILMMDSITRFAMAQREVGLAIGEPPTSRGYTPSVFSHLPRLLERVGRKKKSGSITGIYTVLVEGDDMNEPIADAVRSIVDGHIVLSRELAHQGHYPAIDVLASISRIMKDIAAPGQMQSYRKLINTLATYNRVEDLINLGAYVKGTNKEIDYAIQKIDATKLFLQQDVDEKADYNESIEKMIEMYAK